MSLNNNELNNKSIIDPIHTTWYIYRVPEKQAGVRSPAPAIPRNAFPFIQYWSGLYTYTSRADASVPVEIDAREDGTAIYGKAAAPQLQ